MVSIIRWDKKQPMQIGFTEGYIELKEQNSKVVIEVGINKLYAKKYVVTARTNVIRTPKIVVEFQKP